MMGPMIWGVIASQNSSGESGTTPPVSVGAHRYWRVDFIDITDYISLELKMGYIEMRETVGGPNVLEPSMVTGSSSRFSSPAYAAKIQGDAYWNSARSISELWLQADFGAGNEKEITEIFIWHKPVAGTPNDTPRTFRLQYSDDGSTWTTSFTTPAIPAYLNNEGRVFTSSGYSKYPGEDTTPTLTGGFTIDDTSIGSAHTLSNGDRTLTNDGSNTSYEKTAYTTQTLSASDGKIYYEIFVKEGAEPTNGSRFPVLIDDTNTGSYDDTTDAVDLGDIAYDPLYGLRGPLNVGFLLGFTDGDTIMVCVNPDNGETWIGVNGYWSYGEYDEEWIAPSGGIGPDIGPPDHVYSFTGTETWRLGLQAFSENTEVTLITHYDDLKYDMPMTAQTLAGTPPARVDDFWKIDSTTIGTNHSLYTDDTILFTSSFSYEKTAVTVNTFDDSVTDKLYWEYHLSGEEESTWNGYVGPVGTDNVPSLNDSTNPISSGSVGYRGIGEIREGGSLRVTGLQTFGTGDVVMICYQPSTQEIWVGVNGVWDDDPDSDPATHTNTALGSGEWHIGVQVRESNTFNRLVTHPDMFRYSVPTTAIPVTDLP